MRFDNGLQCDSNQHMAREATTPDQIKALAAKLGEIEAAICLLATNVEKANVPQVRLHLGTLTNILIPQIEHWIDVAQLNANDDIRDFQRGVESRSLVQKRYDGNRKLASATRGAKATAKGKASSSKKATRVK